MRQKAVFAGRTLGNATLWLLLMGACGGDGDSQGPSGPPVPLEDVPSLYANAICGYFERCLGAALVDAFLGSEDCAMLNLRQIESSDFYKVEDGVAAGTITYDGTKVQPCIDDLATRSCEFEQRSNLICEAIFEGSVADGGECEVNEQCKGDSICVFEGACPGSCGPRKVAGLECTEDDECADGLVCHVTTRHCVVPSADGEACEGGVEPQCAAGLLCNGNEAAVPGACMPIDELLAGDAGEPCAVTEATRELCKEGLVCAITAVEAAMPVFECQEGNTTSGGPCTLAFPEDCPPGEYCPLMLADLAAGTLEAECQPLPVAGEACLAAGRAGPRCAPYTRCAADGMCADMRANGETCENSGFCYSGHCVGGVCTPSEFCD